MTPKSIESKKIQKLLEDLRDLDTGTMVGSDFLLTWEHTLDEIKAVLTMAKVLGELHSKGISGRLFDHGLAIGIFRDKSTRTRFSFASAVNALGLSLSELDEQKTQVAHGETVRETAVMISFLTEVLGIRDDMYLGQGNRYMREVSAALDESFGRGILHKRPTIVNLQCDMDHPTQTLSDLLAIENKFGSLKDLKGMRIAVSWAYSPSYGKPLSVPQGLVALLTRFGAEVILAHPEGYHLSPEVEKLAEDNAEKSNGRFVKLGTMSEAFRNADVVYPKSWAPYEVMEKRTELLKKGDTIGLDTLERQCMSMNKRFEDWECDQRRMDLTNKGKALYMHCLPADISGVSCEKGEVQADVFERHRMDTYKQASFKPFVIAAMILLSKLDDPVGTVDRMIRRARPAMEV
ncbi:MAG: knotted carbamoyltransferase YgeW [Deltaproteobacteria bacterium]|nr:knotted carbamoyltransferase YgeW [Deltaproteobacteria bacterium]